MIKYTNQFLVKLEDLIAESDYFLRYEKGNFKSGYCLLHDQKIIIVNKFLLCCTHKSLSSDVTHMT